MSSKNKFFKGIALFVVLSFSFMPQYGFALPQGADVVSGQAAIDVNGNVMNVNVATDKMIANWQSFSIAHPEAVHFYQPSSNSVALNRVVGVDPSSIMGTLTSTGKLFLINPNGVLFGQGSHVDTAGFVASTLGISNDDFLSGKYNFTGSGGSVINRGYISSPGGYVALLGNSVENSGTIVASLGSVALASGKAVTLSLDPQGLISVAVDEATSQNLEGKDSAVKNTGTISAEGGRVILTTKALEGVFDKAVNNEGIIEAKSLVDKTGEVKLIAEGDNSLTSNIGAIDVSAKEVGADGGFVEISGPLVNVGGLIKLDGLGSDDGELLLDPVGDLVILTNTAVSDGISSVAWENTLEALTGSITYNQNGSIYSRLDQTWNSGTSTWDSLGLGDNTLSLAGINSGEFFKLSAKVDINLLDDSIVTGGGEVDFVADSDNNGSGDVNLGTGAGLTSDGGNINLSGVNINLSLVNAGTGDVSLTANGAITDNNGGLINIIANTAILDAADGINLNTQLGQLSARIRNSNAAGEIDIYNHGALTLSSDLAGWGYAVQNAGSGAVNITTASPLTVNSDVLSNGLIQLSAGGASDGNLTVKANVQSSNDNVSLFADKDFVMNSGTVSSAGTINIRTSGIINQSGGTIGNGSETIWLFPYDNAKVSDVQGDNTWIWSTIGSISDFGATSILGNDLFLRAVTGINLNTSVSRLFAHNQSSGNILIDNLGALELTDVSEIYGSAWGYAVKNAGSGAVNITTASPLTVNSDVLSNGLIQLSAGGASDGNLTVKANVQSSNDNVSLFADKDFVMNSGTVSSAGTINIRTSGIINQSGGTIGNGSETIWLFPYDNAKVSDVQGDNTWIWSTIGSISDFGATSILGNDLFLRAVTGINLNTSVSRLFAHNQSSGNILIDNLGALELTDVSEIYGSAWGYAVKNAGSGAVNITTASPMTVSDDVTANGDITLTSADNLSSLLDNIFINADVTSTCGGDVNIIAGDSITQATGTTVSTSNFSGSVGVYADNEGDGSGGITQEGTAQIVSNGGSVDITAGIDEFTGGEDILLTKVDADAGDVFIGSGLGSILDNDGVDDVDIIANGLEMWAYGTIGYPSSLPAGNYMFSSFEGMLDTQVNSIDATSVQGGIYLNETDAVDLVNVQSGATPSIYIFSGGDMNVGTIYDPNDVWLTTMGTMDGISLPNSLVETQDMHLWAKNMINQIQTDVSNIWAYSDTSSIYLYDWNGYASSTPKTFMHLRDINALNTIFVFSGWYNSGDAVDVYADNVVSRNNGQIRLENNLANKGDIYVNNIASGSGLSGGFIKIHGYNSIIDNNGSANNISGYSLEADADNGMGSGNALETILSRLYLNNSTSGNIEIDNYGNLFAEHVINNGGDVDITTHSDLNVGYIEGSDIYLTALDGAINDAYNDTSIKIKGITLNLQAKDGIGDSDTLDTQVSILQALNTTSNNIDIDNHGDLFAQSVINNGGDIYITTHSDLTLGYIKAIGNFVGLNAVNGSILNDSGSSLNILANTAELMALSNIGLAGSPINTNLDILAGFSSGAGDIYINEADSIGLGGIGTSTGTGHSLAAYDGIIDITSAGDMTVNSVIAPRGGVFLETTGGSIYAGQGWCPIVTAPGSYTMDLTNPSTDWQTLGGINYFSQQMNPLPAGPNVIAGGYSYFSAPSLPNSLTGTNGGTIGVGTLSDITVYNPLKVDIQVIPGSHSAVPAPLVPTAGLTLQIGGVAPVYTAPGVPGTTHNGPLGMSGAIEGIVRPATTAVTGVYPSPAIDLTNVTPPGYIFYDGTDSDCASPLYAPLASNIGPQQIWPPYPNGAQYLTTRELRAYYEILDPHRVSFVEPLQPTTFYAYHPILKTDESAFDDITLDVGAYEFINQNINLKKSLAPYFGGTEDKNKKKKRSKSF